VRITEGVQLLLSLAVVDAPVFSPVWRGGAGLLIHHPTGGVLMSDVRFANRSSRMVLALLLCLSAAFATTAAAFAAGPINEADRVVLHNNVNPHARAQFDIGRTDGNLPMERMIMSLQLRPGAQADLVQLLDNLHNPASPQYHQWLTPEQFGERFGITDGDLQAVTSWLTSHGFTVDEVGHGRGWVNFSGNAAQVEEAFGTEIHDFQVDGVVRHANIIDPSVPRAIAGLVNGVVTLHSFPRKALHRDVHKVTPPEFTSGTSHFISPGDFAIIYDLNTAYTAGITGTGQSVAIVARTDIATADVTYFRSLFGLPANTPTFIHNGTDPGDLGSDEETEADLDVEWSGAVAKNATVNMVISKSTTTTDGVDLSAQYIVDNNVSPVMSTSFGSCEADMGTTELSFYNSLWSQAATEGITANVSAGDAGASGCDSGGDTTGTGLAVSGLCSTTFNVCVGGTEFMDTSNPSTYWTTTNSSTDVSVLSYIPEMAWNESGNVSGGSDLWATGGGKSSTYSKPSWQSAPGVPADGKRDIPDISLTAAGHDGYLIVQGHTTGTTGLESVGGTSASSPSFAGIMTLINQKTGARQGNANTVIYPLATAQYSSGGTAVFHDVTTGNNSVPGVTGYTAGTGYDLCTGVGTVDGTVLINNWGGSASPNFAISASPTAVSVVQGAAGHSTITTTVSGGFNAAVTLTAAGQPSTVTVGFSPNPIAAPGSGTSTMTITVGATTATGTYPITVTGTSGSTTHNTTVTLTVTSSTCTPPAAPTGVSATATGQTTATVSWSPSSGATSYTISRSTTSGGPYTAVGTSTTTSFADTGLSCNTTYYYVVSASNGSCASGNSSQASTTTSACSSCTSTTLYTNTFETGSGLSDWNTGTFVSGGSTVDWRGIQACTAHSGTHVFRFGGTSCTADYGNNRFAFAQPKGATGIVVAATGNTTRLSFWHHYGYESGYDGGAVAVSVDGTNYTLAPASAIVSGSSYNGTINAACPPAGAAGTPVFTGSQSSFVNTVVNLDTVCNSISGGTGGCAGKTLHIAFTSITDCSNVSTGWFLDDVTVTDCQ
jgi:pseudomonalisin